MFSSLPAYTLVSFSRLQFRPSVRGPPFSSSKKRILAPICPRKGFPSPEVEKVWQPGNLVARKFLKNQALAESFWILLPHFVAIEQFGGNGKEMILVFLQNGHIFHNFQQKLSVCLVFHYYFLLAWRNLKTSDGS